MHNLINNKAYSEKSLLKLATSSQNDSISTLVNQNESKHYYLINKPEAIIIANGKDWLIEKNQILDYLKSNNLETLHINYPEEKYTLPFIQGFCSCDPIKIINDYKSYSKSRKIPLICPLSIVKRLDIDLQRINTIDYGCKYYI